MQIKKSFVAVLVFSAFSLLSGSAFADYVCNAAFVPYTGGAKGSEGYVYATMYSGPNCTGSLVGVRDFCSHGATSTSCLSNAAYRFSRADLRDLLATLQAASIHDENLGVLTSTCNGGAAGCAAYVIYH
jgi:hypothetical protein